MPPVPEGDLALYTVRARTGYHPVASCTTNDSIDQIPVPDKNQKTSTVAQHLLRAFGAVLFIGAAAWYASSQQPGIPLILVVAAAVGAYMAMNIGANDVANNVGPAVGSGAMKLLTALVIAAVFESAGALIAGGDVVSTVRGGIVQPDKLPGADAFVVLMLSALLAAAIWINIATTFGAPVSTTHSIVGAVLGAGVAVGGFDVVDWPVMGAIAASWVVSPVMGGLIAGVFLYSIKRGITYQRDMVGAARALVPLLIAIMALAFSAYTLTKGLGKLIKVPTPQALAIGAGVAVVVFLLMRQRIFARAATMENSKQGINRLFNVPLVFAAALLSFAHGSNDVANAIGPLAGIVASVNANDGGIATSAAIPFWVMGIGAIGIAIGLLLYGARVIRIVGSEITELDQVRAFCIAMAATLTVIIASQLGLPVSTTHVAVGGVFGVGFLREYLKTNYERIIDEIRAHHPDGDQDAINAFITRFTAASIQERGAMLRELKREYQSQQNANYLNRKDRKGLRKVYKRELVKRSHIMRIVAAWLVTVPLSAVLAAMIEFMIKGMMATF